MKTFPIMLNMDDRIAVVVGGGPVGLRKVRSLRRAGAQVKLVAEKIDESEDLLGAELRREPYHSGLLEGAFLVFACTDDRDLNVRIAADARKVGAMVNTADQPEDCDFFLPAAAYDRDVVVAVGTGGASPVLAGKLRQYIATALPRHIGEFAAALAKAREKLQSEVLDGDRRSEIMRRLADDDVFEAFCKRGPAAVRSMLKSLISGD
ncbi:MAG: bifunctional precorrin-2 dehydrogenase/sirohydrochlorin ferrochelatase [Phycisphaerae bacterium]|nr:bifunctional precorrin-2 dehydrogenase/sirohydrochlorin ferrochelatase [Phycisphaerae bacterium]